MISSYRQIVASWPNNAVQQRVRIRYKTAFCVIASTLAVIADFGYKSMHANLHEALLRGDIVTARKYLKYQIKANAADFAEALNAAARHNDPEGMLTVLSYCPNMPLTPALRIAAGAKSPDAVMLLLDRGADASAIDEDGNSLLSFVMNPFDTGGGGGTQPEEHDATLRRNLVITLLRQNGARFTLLESVRYADTKSLESEIERGADPNSFAETGITPLALAYLQLKNHPSGKGLSNRSEVLAILRAHNAHCRYYEAVQCGLCEELKWHLEHGANPNERLNQGAPYVCICAGADNIQAVQILLDYGADPNSATQTGRTLLKTARATRNSDLERLLLARGARDE